ncbi:ribonuclease P protein component [Metamycoplasma alkalescens]|uniref:Ribonuclease P protein component n=2 Tax=Metamycoplasma alkalescens TaxID=45363 RepID=N9SR91_9BACT|nr:ribonuclease P protein component [Metamycoplasma alkalescens]ENY53990.1 Ribonuclease P protein component [Metamycoplasma alkalescens 14918]PYF42649.1 ribonuclease P protein component [Metamycoplasma alkalescens]
MNKKNTVKKNWEFQKILDSRNQVISRNLIVYFNKSNYFRVGISIPKQFANAVQRNHYKNQIRAILRKMDVTKINYDTVIIARKNFFSLSWEEKVLAVHKIYERIINGKTK